MKRKVVGLAATVVGLWLVVTSCTIPMGDLGGPFSSAADINNASVAVGASATPASTPGHPVMRATRRLPDGTVIDLGTLPGQSESTAIAINDAGVVVGTSAINSFPGPVRCPGTGYQRAVMWSATGVITDLGFLPNGCLSEPRAINEAGVVVGLSNAGGYAMRAFVYDPAVGHMVQLPNLPGTGDSTAEGINDQGQVVGRQWSTTTGVAIPVLWDLTAGTVTDLSSTGLQTVRDINDAGMIVGATPSTAANGWVREAAVWAPGSSTATLIGAGPQSVAYGVNASGVVIGSGTGGAFRWDAAAGLDWLAPKATSSSGYGINDQGQLVGTADDRAVIFGVDPPT